MTAFDVEVGVRWTDLDAQSHVNNATVVDYLQQARIRVLLGGPNAHILDDGIVIVSHAVEYAAPIAYTPEPLHVVLRIGDVGAARLTYDYVLSQRGRVVARARSTAASFDFETGGPRRFTPAQRDWFTAVAEPLEPWAPLGPFTLGKRAHHYPFAVRWSDQDAYGHVNNVQFYTYLGEARVALNLALGPSLLPTAMGSAPTSTLLIARQDLRYIRQMGHRLEPYEVRTGVARVGRTSITFAHEIVDPLDGTVYARGAAVLVHADAEGRPSDVPPTIREAAERWPTRA